MVSNKYTQTDPYDVDVCMNIEDNTAVVVNAAEGTFTNRSIFFDENGKCFHILSIAVSSGFNVNRNKTSILVEGDFRSKRVYLNEVRDQWENI